MVNVTTEFSFTHPLDETWRYADAPIPSGPSWLERAWRYVVDLWDECWTELFYIVIPRGLPTVEDEPIEVSGDGYTRASREEVLLRRLYHVSHHPKGISIRSNSGSFDDFREALEKFLASGTQSSFAPLEGMSGCTGAGVSRDPIIRATLSDQYGDRRWTAADYHGGAQ